jgi:hypothetical protein
MTRYTGQFPQEPYRGYRDGPQRLVPMPGMTGQPNTAAQEGIKGAAGARWLRPRAVAIPLTIAILAGVIALGVYFAYRSGLFDLSGPRSGGTTNVSAERATAIFSGRPSELIAARGNLMQADSSNSSIVWIRSSLKTAKSNGATDGVSVKVPDPLIGKILGRRIRVTVSARGADRDQSPFAVAYSTGAASNSGWLVFQPTKEFTDFSFNYVVPRSAPGSGHSVGIWSDITGRDAPLAIRQITITELP